MNLSNVNLTDVQSTLAPILTPIAPAVLFGNNLYTGMVADGVNSRFALLSATLGTMGTELSGALACSMAVMAYHKRDYKIMAISIISAIVYAIFVVVGILQAPNTATFAGAVIISLVAYLMQGVWQSYNNRVATEQKESAMRLQEMDAERKLVNAMTRNAKAGGVSVQRMSTGGRQATQFQSDTELISEIQAYWDANPNATYREVATAIGCSPMTAGKYKPGVHE